MFSSYLFLIFLFLSPSSCTLLSSSTLEKCVNSLEDCEKKIIVSMAVEGDDSSTLAFTVDKVIDGESGEERRLASPLNISLSKSNPEVVFQLKLEGTVNAAPFEVLLPRQLLLESCDDDFTEDATCGLAIHTETGQPIPNSQGYCCTCDISTFFANRDSRASHSCEQYGSGSSTASCMRFSPLWYSLSSLFGAVVDFEVVIDIKYQQNNKNFDEKLIVKPDLIFAQSSTSNITARLVGDFSSFDELPTFSNKFFALPIRSSTPLPSWLQEVVVGQGEEVEGGTMLINREDVDFGGRVCNKIGVSYEAHQFQAQKCENQEGSCFNNQLLDFYFQDKHALENGQPTNYILSSFGDFRYENQLLRMSTNTDVSSLVVLTVVADNLTFIVAESDGEIVSLSILEFESGNKGELEVVVRSKGTNQAQFFLSFNCSKKVVDIPGKTLNLAPEEQTTLIFDVYVGVSEEEEDHFCDVGLVSSQARELDTKRVEFSTEATPFSTGSPSPPVPPPQADDDDDDGYSCDSCGFLAMSCLYDYCRWQFSLLILLFFSLFLLFLLSCWCFLCRGRKKKRRRRKRERRWYDEEGGEKEEGKGCCGWCCWCLGGCWGCLWGGCGKKEEKKKDSDDDAKANINTNTSTNNNNPNPSALYPPPPPYPYSISPMYLPPNSAPFLPQQETGTQGERREELEEWCVREKMVFFNVPFVRKEDRSEFPVHPGPNFSLGGVLKQEQNMKFSFYIPNDFQFQLKRFKKKKGEEQKEGYQEVQKGHAPLPPRFCQTKGMSLSDVASFVSSQPKFMVIN